MLHVDPMKRATMQQLKWVYCLSDVLSVAWVCNMEIYIYGQISLGHNDHFEGACNYIAHSKCIKKQRPKTCGIDELSWPFGRSMGFGILCFSVID